MKYLISVAIASMLVFTGAASAQVLGVVGWGQGGGATSSSAVGGAGGSGAALFGLSGTQTSATSGNVSGALVTQTPGTTNVITESVSTGGMQSTSGALGLAGAASGSVFGATGSATGAGGQLGAGLFFAP